MEETRIRLRRGITVRQRDGAWWVFVNHQGTRRAKRAGTKKDALRVARNAEKAILAGAFRVEPPRAPLFRDYAKTCLQQHHRVNGIKDSTAEEYDKALRLYLLPAFGDRSLSAINRAAVRQFVAGLRESGSVRRKGQGLSPAAVRLIMAPLRLVLEDALADDLIPANPALGIGRWNRRTTETETVDPFTRAELQAITQAAETQVPLLWPLVGVWAQTGMREGEVFGLEWQDLDLEAGTALVRRTLSRGRLSSPKTGRSRVVTLTHPMLDCPEAPVEALKALRSVREAEAAVKGSDLDPTAHVFLQPDGRAMSPHILHSGWRRCLKAAGVRYRPPEQFRHTFASTLLSRGVSLLYVQRQGGWADANTLLKHYSRWLPQDAPRSATGCNQAATDPLTVGIHN